MGFLSGSRLGYLRKLGILGEWNVQEQIKAHGYNSGYIFW